MKPDLYRMFYLLDDDAQAHWAEIVRLPSGEYEERLSEQTEDSK